MRLEVSSHKENLAEMMLEKDSEEVNKYNGYLQEK